MRESGGNKTKKLDRNIYKNTTKIYLRETGIDCANAEKVMGWSALKFLSWM